MKKIIYLFFTCLFLITLTGCQLFDFFKNDDEPITITYVYGDKTLSKTYDSYEKVTFETYSTTTGYEFLGWSKETDGLVITKNDLKGITNIKLYPVINLINYKIIYDLDGGINNSNNPSFYTIEDEITINQPTKENCAFTGWYVNGSTTLITNYKIEKGTYGDINLKANYVYGQVNVEFKGYSELNQIIDYNTCATKPADPYKFGDTFICWCTDDGLTTEFDFTTPLKKSITLYPKWTNTKFYTLKINNIDLIESNYENNSSLPKDATINLKANYLIEGYEFLGWYIDDNLYSRYYILEYSMPSNDLEITPEFKSRTTLTYTKGSNTNLNTGIEQESTGLLLGNDIDESYYSHSSNNLYIKYSFLDKLNHGLYSFIYENRIIFDVLIKVKEKDVTNIFIDYDVNYPYATLTFDEVSGYNYSYSLDDTAYINCHSGDIINITDKFTEHNLSIKCDDKITNYVIEELPNQASEYASNTFTYQGNTYDHYADSIEDIRTIIEYYALAKYPSVGGTKYEFSFYNSLTTNGEEIYAHIVKDVLSIPYGLTYQYTTGSKKVDFILKSSGKFNSLITTQEKTDVTTTYFAPSNRSDDFNDFYIENCSKTQEIRSIYELEALNVGIKPIILDETALLVYNKAKEILRTYVSDDMNEFEKLKAIYDYLGSYVTYDDALLSISTNRSDYASFTSYAALINGIAVCDGIASAYKLLCIIEGIRCEEIIGSAKGGGHAWNKVYVGGACFGVDATWSRAKFDGEYRITHTYFLVDEINLINFGDSHHYEQGDSTSFNITDVANNNLGYYELFVYDGYDLICSSKLEYEFMLLALKNHNQTFIELKLDGVTYSEIRTITSSYYTLYYSTTDSTLVYLVH